MHRYSSSTRICLGLAAASIAAAFTLAPAPAGAHFVLKAPTSSTKQDALGNPQKAPPCGDDGTATPSGQITTYAPGETIMITINETIFHPGHYRVALAPNDPNELPPEPIVTPDANSPCGSTTIMDPPVYPVLADGELVHTDAFNGEQTIMVTLPKDVTCDKCTLQVIQFMSNHALNNPGGCYYHHCANIAIKPGGGMGGGGAGGTGGSTGGAGGSTGGAGGDAGAGGDGGQSSGAGGAEQPPAAGGCGCSVPGGEAPAFGAIASALALLALRRKRR